MQRYFAQAKINNEIKLLKNDEYHIKTVMRMKNHDNIEVVYQETLYLCSIENIDTMNIKIIKELEKNEEILNKITLVIPLLKEQKMDLILQKATELGVSDIIPFYAQNSIIKLEKDKTEKRIERWNKIVKEASEQSKRHNIPNIHKIHTLEELTSLIGEKMICSTTEKTKNLKMFLQSHPKYDTLIIVIGPEGGLDSKEEQYLEQNGYEKVTLGPRIMRVETVPIYLLSILNYESME